jgi:hypothetical protein
MSKLEAFASCALLVCLATSSACGELTGMCGNELEFDAAAAIAGRWSGTLRNVNGHGESIVAVFDQGGRPRELVTRTPSGEVHERFGCGEGEYPLSVGAVTHIDGPPGGWVGRGYDIVLRSAHVQQGGFELVHDRAARYGRGAERETVVERVALVGEQLQLERSIGGSSRRALLRRD